MQIYITVVPNETNTINFLSSAGAFDWNEVFAKDVNVTKYSFMLDISDEN